MSNIPHQTLINISIVAETYTRNNIGECTRCVDKIKESQLVSFKGDNISIPTKLRDKFIKQLKESINDISKKLHENTDTE